MRTETIGNELQVRADELRGLIGKVRNDRRFLDEAHHGWSWRKHIVWRWLLPFWAGRHYGMIEALERLEIDLHRELLACLEEGANA